MNTTNPQPERDAQAASRHKTPDNDAAPGSGAEDIVTVSTAGVARTRNSRDSDSRLEPLFQPDAATEFRSRWDEVQRGFVDDPQRAVKAGDDLVMQVIQSLSQSFSSQRQQLTKDLNDQERSTEGLRIALRRYRAFFDRLLAM